jgi:hypothetical protein
MTLPNNEVVEKYIRQAAENHALQIDKKFWLVVKQKPRWMPMFVYKSVISELVDFITIS